MAASRMAATLPPSRKRHDRNLFSTLTAIGLQARLAACRYPFSPAIGCLGWRSDRLRLTVAMRLKSYAKRTTLLM